MRALGCVRIDRDRQILPTEAEAHARGLRVLDGVDELVLVFRVRVARELRQVDRLRLPRLEVDERAGELGRLVLAWGHRDRQHDGRDVRVGIVVARPVGHLERDRGRAEVAGLTGELEGVVVDHEVVAVRMRRPHCRRIRQAYLAVADGDDVVVQVDRQLLLAGHAQFRGAALDLRQRVVVPGHAHERVRRDLLVIRVGDPERDDLALRRDGDADALARGHLGIVAVARHDGEPEAVHRPVREEDVREHVHRDRALAEDVGEPEHGVAGDRSRKGGVLADGHPDEVLARAPALVLDRVDEARDALGLRGLHRHDVADDLRCRLAVERRDLRDRQWAAVRIGVVGQNLDGEGLARANGDIVFDGDGVARAIDPWRDPDPDDAGGTCAERIHHRVGERVRPRGVLARLVVHPVGPGSDDGALLGIRLLPDELDGVAVGVDSRQRNRDAHGVAREDSRCHGLRHRRIVRRTVALAHRDADFSGGPLAVCTGDPVHRSEVARLRGRQVAKLAARGEEKARPRRQRRRERRIEGELVAVGLHVVGKDGDVGHVADTHRDRVRVRDRGLVDRQRRQLDHRDRAFGLGEAVADAVMEVDRGVEGTVERHAEDALAEDLDPHASEGGRRGNRRDQEHAARRVEVGGQHVDGLGRLLADERGVRHGDRLRLGTGGRFHVDADRTGGREHTVGDRVLEVVRSHLVAGEPERPALEVGGDRGVRLGGHVAEPHGSRSAAHVQERGDRHLLALIGEHGERVGDDRHRTG